MKSKKKLFIENFLVYGLGSMINKIIPLVMLPIITKLMPDTFYFGVNDMVNLTTSFVTAIVILGVSDAMFRLLFEKNKEHLRKNVCSSALAVVLISGTIVTLIMIVLKEQFSILIFKATGYEYLIVMAALIVFMGTINSLFMNPTRMENKRKVFIFVNSATSILGYVISVPMLINKNYLYALPVGTLLSSVFAFIVFFILNRTWFNINLVSWDICKELLYIGVPIMPTFIVYWIFNSLDRIMIQGFWGLTSVGIYAIGAKVASVSQLIYQAFAQGWQYFAFSTMNDEDNVETISKILEYLFIISFISIIIIMPFTKFVFNLLFEGDYVKGYLVFPYMYLSPLMLMLFQTIGSQFMVIKKSYLITIILAFGALTNVGLNYWLIPILNTKGAGIATLTGYIVSLVLTAIILTKSKLLKVSRRLLFNFGLFIIFLILISFDISTILFGLIILIIIGISMKGELKQLTSKIYVRR